VNEREIILRLINLEREEKRRQNDALEHYNKGVVHQKQMLFHRSPKRNRWVFGGNRSGKTECGAVEAVWIARGIHPFRQNRANVFGWVVSVTFEVQRDVAQAKILKYLSPRFIEDIVMQSGRKGAPEYGIIDHIVVKNASGGLSKIGFKSCDQGREKFQGASLDFVWFDEEPPKEIYDECRMRVFDRSGDIFGTMTPLKGLSWVYDEIELNVYDNPEVWCEHIAWEDNPFLPKEEMELLLQSTSSDAQQSRRFGRFFQNTGLVYPEFCPQKHIIEPFSVPVKWQAGISIDPGLNNPTSCHFYAVDFDGTIYVVGEHYEKGRDVDYHAQKIFELADTLNWQKDGEGRLCALIDSAASQRTLASQKSVAELFFEKNIAVDTRVNKDLFSGIARLKELFNADPPRILIFKNCVNLIRELKSYWWGDGDRPKKADDHALDELRYFVMSRPKAAKQNPKPLSAIARDKEMLIKKMNAARRRARISNGSLEPNADR